MVEDSVNCSKVEGGDILKKRFVVGVSALLTVVTLIAIWQFSAQSAADSSALSGHLAEVLNQNAWLNRVVDVNVLESVLRKLAHGFVYFILGIGLAGVLSMWSPRFVLIMVPILGLVFAALDEFHQSFVPGRGPSVRDVLIDLGGVCLGMLIMLLLRRCYRHFSSKQILAD